MTPDPGPRGLAAGSLNVDSAFQHTPTLRTEGLADQAAAGQAIGNATQKIGGAMGALLMKAEEARGIRQEADADNAMILEEGEIDAAMTAERDESKWDGIAQKRIDALKNKLSKESMVPAAREAVNMKMELWSARQTVRAQGERARESFRRTGVSIDEKLKIAALTGNRAAHEATLAGAVEKNYMTPEGAEIARLRYTEIVEQKDRELKAEAFSSAQDAAVGAAAAGGEDAALKQLDSGAFGVHDASDKERIRNAIQQVARDRSAETLDTVSSGILDGSLSNDAAIDAVQSPFLTPKLRQSAKEYLKSFDAYKVQQDKETNGVRNAVEMRRKVKDYDPSADPDRTGYFKLLAEAQSRVTQSAEGEITGELYRKYGTAPPKLKVRPEIEQNVSKSLDLMFDPMTGAMPWRSETTDSTGKKIVKDDAGMQQKALDAQTTIEMKMNDWFKDHPEDAGSLPKVRAKLQELLPEGTRAAALEGLFKLSAPKAPELGDIRGFTEPAGFADKLPAGLKAHAQDFIEAARENGLNPKTLAAISALETGGGTSKAFREKNNAMGISDDSGPLTMSSVRDSIFRQARTLARADGPYAKAKTLDEIGAIYAPSGAANDFKGTNDGWAENVRAWLARL